MTAIVVLDHGKLKPERLMLIKQLAILYVI